MKCPVRKDDVTQLELDPLIQVRLEINTLSSDEVEGTVSIAKSAYYVTHRTANGQISTVFPVDTYDSA